MSGFPIIDVQGTPYECGLQYGQQAADLIAHAADVYEQIFHFYSGDTRAQVREKALAYLPYIERFDADIAQELHGIADGSSVELADILALNARTELMSSVPMRGECTVFGVLSPATQAENKVILAQNWDWLEATAELPVLLRIQQPGKATVLALAEAGQVGKIGMNSAGFGVCLNWLASELSTFGSSSPYCDP